MPLWKCLNPKCSDTPGRLGHTFEGPEPVCPKCGVDARNQRFAGAVVPVMLIHYDPPSNFPGIGLGHPACDERRTQAMLNHSQEQVTSEPGAVTCAACRASGFWPKEWVEMDRARVPPKTPGCC